jgi:hypothetical protein
MHKRYSAVKIGLLVAVILYVIIELNCASRGRPGGGPEDKIPPIIIGTDPLPDSTGVTELGTIEIYFSERMNESSVESSIFISPPLDYETDWSGGDELILSLKDTLYSDRTYVVTIGSGAMDMQKNRMTDSYQFAFSTGDELNRGEIYGKVYGISEKDIFYVYGYQIIDPDSLNPTVVKADFLSQPGPEGNFWLKYLPNGSYRIFVIEDQNKNLLLDMALERVGIPIDDVTLDTTNSPVGPLNFRVTRIDTTRPEITGARAVNNRTVLLRINEIVELIGAEKITIQDTLSGENLSILDFSPNKDEAKQYYLYTAHQDSGKGYRVFVTELEDTSGNIQEKLQIANFVGSELVDTTRFELTKILPADSLQGANLNASIELTFSIPIDTAGLQRSFYCLDKDSNTIRGSWSWDNLSQGYFLQEGGFKSDQQYSFLVNSASIRSLWGDSLSDSTYSRLFFTISGEEFGSISGSYTDKMPDNSSVHIHLMSVDRNKNTYQLILREGTDFHFSQVAEGQYKIGGFVDLDNNGKFSAGNLFPFQFSEPYVLTNDTLRVRKRWEISDIIFTIPEPE